MNKLFFYFQKVVRQQRIMKGYANVSMVGKDFIVKQESIYVAIFHVKMVVSVFQHIQIIHVNVLVIIIIIMDNIVNSKQKN
mgnify:FL=1